MKKIYTLIMLVMCLSPLLKAQTPIFPYYEAFDTFPQFVALNGHGGLTASSHVQIYPRGIGGTNCGEFQMTPFASSHYDTVTSPLIGNLTSNSAASFYFRVVQYSGGVPSVYNMTASDKVDIYVGSSTLAISLLQYTINSSNQNTGTGYVKVTVPAPAFVNGLPGKFRIIASNPSANDWLLEIDSLVVRDTLAPVLVAPTLTDSVGHVKCRAQSNGSIKVIASGAHPPYTYLWNTGSTTDTISMRPAGAYSVTVTDSLGGFAVLRDTIREPARTLIADSLPTVDVACHGDHTGSAAIYVSGGTSPYRYLWNTSPAGIAYNIQNQTSGNYVVTVTDDNGCTVVATARISQPAAALTVVTNTTPSSGNNGTAVVSVNGGTSPYTYEWKSASGTVNTPIASQLGPGIATIKVTDAHGCVVMDTVTISPAGLDEVHYTVKLYPNPASNILRYEMDGLSGQSVSISCTDMMGRTWNLNREANNTINVSSIAAGIYSIQIKTAEHLYIQRLLIER